MKDEKYGFAVLNGLKPSQDFGTFDHSLGNEDTILDELHSTTVSQEIMDFEKDGIIQDKIDSEELVVREDGAVGATSTDEEDDQDVNESSPWLRNITEYSLPEYHGQIPVPRAGEPWYRVLRAYLGPGSLVAVGYMDPGNWVTDLAGGSAYGYTLLFVIGLSSLMAMFLQYLSLKAGLATSRDLAQICRDSYHPYVSVMLWIIMEVAICATDIAEVLGSAIALKLLFGLPLIAGVCLTACDVLILLFLNGSKFIWMERFVTFLIVIIIICFSIQLGYSSPNAIDVLGGFIPSDEIFKNNQMLFVGVGIIGATVMPHNLFLHSSIILTRQISREDNDIKEAIHYGGIDSILSLTIAFFVNAAILMIAAATFHKNGYNDIATLEDAYQLLEPILHSQAAPIVFGIALLAAGQNATLTGTLTGQIVMEGFMNYKISPTLRRLITRLLAILPAVLTTAIGGDAQANTLLLFSQVILSFALPFAVIPLVHITSSPSRMGKFVNATGTTVIAWIISGVIIAMNIVLLIN